MTQLCECGCGRETVIAKKTSRRDGTVRGRPNRFILGHHIGRGEASITWKGGRSVMGSGYVRVYVPGHHRATNGYVLEHIIVAEKALGRPLEEKHPVHHFDLNRANNANSNLVICEDEAYHKLLHQRQRALEAA
jgi:hypothetical protein